MKTQKIRSDSGVPTNSRLAVILAGLICFISVVQSFGEQENKPKQEKQDLITKTYDILDIIIPVVNHKPPRIILISGTLNESSISSPMITGDSIVVLIKDNFDEDWTDKDIAFSPQSGLLVVKQSSSVHKRIEEFLAYLRGIRKKISIEAKLVAIDNPTLYEIREKLSNTAILDDKALQTILEKGIIYKTAQQTACNGQEIYTSDIKVTNYTKQYDVVIVNSTSSKAEGQPIIDYVYQGMVFSIKPFITPNKNIRMDIKLQNSELLSMEKVNPVRYGEYDGNIELPTTDNTDIKTTALAQFNQTVLAAIVGIKESNKSMLLLVTPKLIEEEPKTEYFTLTPAKVIKIFDLNSMTYPYSDWFVSSVIIQSFVPGGGSILAEPTQDLPPTPIYPFDGDGGIFDILHNQFDISKCLRIDESNNIVVIGNLDVIKKAEEAIMLLSKPYDTSCLVTVSGQLLTISDIYWQNLIKDKKIDINRNLVVDSNVIKDLLTETGKGKIVKLIASAEVTGFNRQMVCVAQMRQTNYIQCLEVQGGAIAYQPIANIINSGVSLNVRPIILKDNLINLLLDWRFNNLIKLDTQTTRQGAFMFQKPQLENQCFLSNIEIQDGIWTIVQVTSERNPKDGLQHKVIFIKASVVK